MSNAVRYRDANDPAQTAISPAYLLDPLRRLVGGFGLDPCTPPDNPVGAEKFYCPPTDGLVEPWGREPVYVNPPYGKAREPWVRRCLEVAEGGCRVLLLMPAATDTRCFQAAAREATSVLLVRGRLKFGVLRPNRRQAAASHPSALFGFNVDLSPLSALGLVVRALPDGVSQCIPEDLARG